MRASAMVFGVDGTGPFSNTEYRSSMENSFVSRICKWQGARFKRYWRGPDGIDTLLSGPNPRAVADEIRSAVAAPTEGRSMFPNLFGMPPVFCPPTFPEPGEVPVQVFLTGYSRGAATVIDAAGILKEYGIAVEAMFLFDSVTRSPWLSGKTISSNVKNCYHAKRSSLARSRISFGNSPAVPEKGVKYDCANHFFTTHAGMGGTPWGPGGLLKPVSPQGSPILFPSPTDIAAVMVYEFPDKFADKIYEAAPDWNFTAVTVDQERLGMNLVHDWMWRRLNNHGIKP